mmetsp:Transcript_453/g.977  ORF Transcript_453/g.977 Transcript_453/m.977 type:complete len:329 (-) Transcript_453:591-1577(-)
MRGVTDYLPLAVDQDPNSERNKEARRLRERIHTRQRCAFFCLCLLVPGAVILAVQALWSSNRVAGEWKPEPRRDVPGWRHLHQEYVREAREFSKDLQLVLYGDSLVESWRGTSRADPVSRAEGIPEVWNEKFGQFGKTAIALGISGDYTKHLTWRLQHGEVADGMSPAVVVLLIGTNDLSECELLLVRKPLASPLPHARTPSRAREGRIRGVLAAPFVLRFVPRCLNRKGTRGACDTDRTALSLASASGLRAAETYSGALELAPGSGKQNSGSVSVALRELRLPALGVRRAPSPSSLLWKQGRPCCSATEDRRGGRDGRDGAGRLLRR